METLQRKLSGTSLDVPVPPPRRSVATNDNNPYPSAPEISETSSTDELLTRLASVEQMNKDWLIYNETREQFVQQLTAKHHETINQLRRAMEEIHRMQQCPGALSEEQRKHYDGTLVEAKAEMDKMKERNESLGLKVKSMEEKYLAEVERRRVAEHQAAQFKLTVEHLENVNEKLTKTIQKDRRRSDRIEETLNNLSNQVSSMSSTRSSPRKSKAPAPPRPESPSCSSLASAGIRPINSPVRTEQA